MDGLLRRGRLMRPDAPIPAGRACAGGSGRSRRSSSSPRRRRRSSPSGSSLVEPDRHEPAAGRRVRRPPGRVRAGRDPHPRHEPAAGRADDRLGDGRRRDRAVHARRPGDARPAALEHDRRPVRVGRGRADHRRHHELDRHRDVHEIPAAVETPSRIGAGLPRLRADRLPRRRVPIALGLLWLPSLRRAERAVARGLHGADRRAAHVPRRRGAVEALELQAALPGALGGAGLVLLGVALSYLDADLRLARGGSRGGGAVGGLALATLVAIGIGLHNLGEGLAIGSSFALGELTLGTFLIVGFMIHNVTEGLGIAAPIAEGRRRGSVADARRLAWSPARRRSSAPGSAASSRATCSACSSSPPRPAPRSRSWSRSGATSPAARPAGSPPGYAVGGFLAGLAVMYATGLLAA